MAFGTPANPGISGLVGGETLKVYLWSDDDGDGDPSDGGFTLLNTTIATVSAASIDTDVFQNVAIAPTAVPPSGFFIGYAVTHAAGTFPLSQDQSQASLGRAWVGGDTGGSWDPATMGGDVAVTEMDAAGLPGVWLLRATGVPAAPPCPCDCADPPDGTVSVLDFLALLAQWGTPGPCDCADPPDGTVSVLDFLALLAGWGDCPSGVEEENEPDCGLPVDTVNGGCNSSPEVFSPIVCGQTYNASSAFDGSQRDTDWYEIVVDEPTVFTWTVTPQFRSLIGLAETIPPGSGDCADYTGSIRPYARGGVGEMVSVTTDCLPPGTYWFYVASQGGDIVPCPTSYVATLTCDGPCSASTIYGLDFRGTQFFQSTPNDFVGDFTTVGTTDYSAYAIDMDVNATTLYAVLSDGSNTYGTIDTGTGDFTAMGTLSGPSVDSNVSGMSVDPVSGSWYLSVMEAGTAILYVGDITTGVFAPVGDITFPLNIDLAIDSQGNAYGHDIGTDELISINLATGQGTAIGPTGQAANFAQGMDFDYADDTLYATIYTGGGTGVFATFNLLTGQATALQSTTPLDAEMEMVVATPLGPAPIRTINKLGAAAPGGSQD
ncbi:MAG: NHL repeat-containing protein, partial [Planctomycetota bacterium]|jgi:hypothetical protein